MLSAFRSIFILLLLIAAIPAENNSASSETKVIVLGIAHTGGSILWVFSTVLLQRSVEDNFRGRVFAAELALLTLTMAASNYVTGELLDRFGISPRIVTIAIGSFFLLPGIIWFLTRPLWDREETGRATADDRQELSVVHQSVE